MSKLPVIPGGAPPRSLNDRIARLRQATGQPERCHLPLYCSAASAPRLFVVGFERMSPADRFQATDQGQPVEGAGGRGSGPSVASFDSAAFAPYASRCPYCGDNSRVHCSGCERTWCQGSVVERSGKRVFPCPVCKNEGELTASGAASREVQALKPNAHGVRVAGLLGGSESPRLAGPKPAQLPGQAGRQGLPWFRK